MATILPFAIPYGAGVGQQVGVLLLAPEYVVPETAPPAESVTHSYCHAQHPTTVESQADPSAHSVGVSAGYAMRDNSDWFSLADMANAIPVVQFRMVIASRSLNG